MKPSIPIAASLAALIAILACGCGQSDLESLQANPVAHHSDQPADNPEKGNIIFFCPDDDVERTQEVKQAFFKALQTAVAGTRWHVFGSSGHDHLTSFTIPEATGRRRFRELQNVLPKLHAFFDNADPEADGQVNLPAMSASIVNKLTTETTCNVSIFGSPRYLCEDQDGFQHNSVFVTKDGSVGDERSPFKLDHNLPTDTRVVWVTPQSRFGYNAEHEDKIRHFNGYYIQCLGGTLLRTTEDASMLFDFRGGNSERLIAKHDDAGKYKATTKTQWNGDEGIEIVDFNDDDVDAPGDGVEDSPETVFSAAEINKGTMALGINYQSLDPACDMDMHLTSNGLQGELSWSNQETTWGQHFNDVRGSSSQSEVEDYSKWEWIRVDHSRLHDLTLYLNMYDSTAPARVTIVRVWNGERKTRVIDFNVSKGDGGRGRNNRRASDAWVRVSLYAINANDPPGTR